ncbi:ATPase, T2SS/T4P/T4SS family, partial [Bacillus subtilis]
AIAYLFMRALINGHDGSGSTIHASSCQAGLDQAVELAAGHPSAPDRETIRRIMWDRLGYVVHMNPTDDGRTIRELCQVQDNGDLHTVSRYVEGIDPTGKLNGYYEFIGPTDEFVQKMIQAGIEVPSTWKWRKSK